MEDLLFANLGYAVQWAPGLMFAIVRAPLALFCNADAVNDLVFTGATQSWFAGKSLQQAALVMNCCEPFQPPTPPQERASLVNMWRLLP